MDNMLDYNGYKGTVEFSLNDQVFYGQIFGINDTVMYEGSSVKELQKMFREAVDDYLETCKEMGKEPERAFKGSFNVRIKPELHRLAALKAVAAKMSLNEFIENAIAGSLKSIESVSVRTKVSSKKSKSKS